MYRHDQPHVVEMFVFSRDNRIGAWVGTFPSRSQPLSISNNHAQKASGTDTVEGTYS